LLLVLIAVTWLIINWMRSAFAKKERKAMSQEVKAAIVVGLIVAVVAVVTFKRKGPSLETPAEYTVAQLTGQGLPMLVDLGAGKCVACKTMKPILEQLKTEMEGKMSVHVLDTGKYPGLTDEYQIKLIPTQIFYDASGNELFRHEGFISREDILAKWAELGVDLGTRE
jgi:thioredoxin 1